MTEMIRAAYATANEILRSSPHSGFHFIVHMQMGSTFEALPLSTDPLTGVLSGSPAGSYWTLETTDGETLMLYPNTIAAIVVREV